MYLSPLCDAQPCSHTQTKTNDHKLSVRLKLSVRRIDRSIDLAIDPSQCPTLERLSNEIGDRKRQADARNDRMSAVAVRCLCLTCSNGCLIRIVQQQQFVILRFDASSGPELQMLDAGSSTTTLCINLKTVVDLNALSVQARLYTTQLNQFGATRGLFPVCSQGSPCEGRLHFCLEFFLHVLRRAIKPIESATNSGQQAPFINHIVVVSSFALSSKTREDQH